jgi:hypothetical protein
MSADGMGDVSISELTGLNVLMVRHLIDQDSPPRMRYEDWERQKKADDSGGCSTAHSEWDSGWIPDQ